MKTLAHHSDKQKKRLRWLLLVFFIFLALPIYYLLQTVYSQLEKEAYFTSRNQAEKMVDQLENQFQQLLTTEQNRSIAEYSFYNVMENPLLSESSGIKFSPLSEIPPKTDIKGLVGYFQINTDGSFHLPALPELGQDNLSGLSLAELENRLDLKQKLRDLLSIKTKKNRESPEKRMAVKDDQDLALEQKTKAQSKPTNQPYLKEFDQLNAPMAEEMVSVAVADKAKKVTGQLNDVTIQSSNVYRKQLNKSTTNYRTRQEVVQLPDQKMANSFFKQSKNKVSSDISKQENIGEIEQENLSINTQQTSSAIDILNVVSEVTPLQLLFLGKDYFCFYRYVWHDNQRYTQGFIVDKNQFITASTQPLFSNSGFNSLAFTKQGIVILRLNNSDSQQEHPIYSRNLSPPFQQLAVILNAAKLKDVPGTLLIDILALAIFCIFSIAFAAFYRLGCRQIELAKQQQNFISAVSHELKTPLTSIRMYGEMLRSGWVSDENKKQNYYDFIFFESERLSRLIANVLQLARLGHQQQKTEIITTSAETLLNKISAKVEAQTQASCFHLNIIPAPIKEQVADIKVDEDAFFQIIINLVDNAIKFAGLADKKQIDIGYKISKNAKQVVFFIRDYGPGIKRDQIKKIFQLFYRTGDELTRTTPGTGIGLALVAQLAETMQADIDVINKQPGAEFQIKLKVD